MKKIQRWQLEETSTKSPGNIVDNEIPREAEDVIENENSGAKVNILEEQEEARAPSVEGNIYEKQVGNCSKGIQGGVREEQGGNGPQGVQCEVCEEQGGNGPQGVQCEDSVHEERGGSSPPDLEKLAVTSTNDDLAAKKSNQTSDKQKAMENHTFQELKVLIQEMRQGTFKCSQKHHQESTIRSDKQGTGGWMLLRKVVEYPNGKREAVRFTWCPTAHQFPNGKSGAVRYTRSRSNSDDKITFE